MRPFEPRRGSILVEQPQLFCGAIKKQSDAFTRLTRQKNEYTVCFWIQALLLGEHRYENFTLRHLQKRIG